MSMTEHTEQQRDATLKLIDETNELSEAQKMLYRNIVHHSAEGTNGLTAKEKLQSVSEDLFTVVCMMVSRNVEEVRKENLPKTSKITSLYTLINNCKNQLCILGLGIVALLVFHPELADIIKSLIK